MGVRSRRLVLELKLRKGVTFHDGAPFDAAAVVANIERGQTMEGSTVVAALKSITGTDIVDEHTVRLRLAPARASSCRASSVTTRE